MKKILLAIFIICLSFSCSDKTAYLYRIVVNNKIGYMDKTGKIIIEPEYDYYGFPQFDWTRYNANEIPHNNLLFSKIPIFNYGDPFATGFAIVKYQDKWGFIDIKGNVVVETKYDEALPFKDGRAAVRIDDKWGYVNCRGKLVIPLEYDEAYYFFENRAWVKKDSKYGFIDENGKIIIPLQYDFNQQNNRVLAYRDDFGFRDGMACVYVDGKYGYINTNGEMIIKPVDEKYWYFHLNHVIIEKNGLMGIMDKKGNYIIEPKYFSIPYDYDEKNLIAFVLKEDGNIGFLNKKGEVILEPQFSSAYWFSEGFAGVAIKKNGKEKWGFINNKGEMVIQPQFDEVGVFKNGTAIVHQTKYNEQGRSTGIRTACIDKTGNYVIQFIDGEIRGLYGDVAIYYDYNKYCYGLIDKSGNKIGEAKYSFMGPFIDGIAEVWITTEDNVKKNGYINKKGKYVWEPK